MASLKFAMNPFGTIELTDQGVEARGLMNRQSIPYARITSVRVNKLLNRLEIETGAQLHRFSLWNQARLPELHAAILERMRPAPAQATRAAESIPDQILKLAQLRDAGALTPDEFEAKKRELLARL